jgi:hypothetical protein
LSASPSPAFGPCGIPLALAPPDELEPPPEEFDDDVAGVDDGDLEPDAGGELPQPATARAMATSAAPIQVRVERMGLLLMLRPPSVSVMCVAKGGR